LQPQYDDVDLKRHYLDIQVEQKEDKSLMIDSEFETVCDVMGLNFRYAGFQTLRVRFTGYVIDV
jgi:hypothetical protein